MKKILSTLVLTTLFFISLNSAGYSQAAGVVGKLYTKADANTTYGPVVSSVTINTQILLKAIEQSPDYLMFNIINGQLTMLSGKRAVIFSTNKLTAAVPARTVFHFFSTSKIKELITLGGNATFTTIELRPNNVLTVTSGTATVEQSLNCPPFCP